MFAINAWDLGCAVTITISGVTGYVSGFVWDTGKWIGAVLGVFAANRFCALAEFYHWQTTIAWLLILQIVWGLFLICISKLSRIVLRSPIALIDKTLGAVAGCARSCLLLVIVFSACSIALSPLPNEIHEAFCYKYLDLGAQYLSEYVRPITEEIRGHLLI